MPFHGRTASKFAVLISQAMSDGWRYGSSSSLLLRSSRPRRAQLTPPRQALGTELSCSRGAERSPCVAPDAASSRFSSNQVYENSGFPEHTYRIRYDAPGDAALAETVRAMLDRGGMPTGLDAQRGYDHGTFSLMHTLYPEAQLPVVQLALKADLVPAEHLPVGELLAPLRDQGVLIIGSGFSYHDVRGIMSGRARSRQRYSTPGSRRR